MSSLTDPIYSQIHGLVTDWMEGDHADAASKKLCELLSKDQTARRVYREYMQETAALRWQSLDSQQLQDEIQTLLPSLVQANHDGLAEDTAASSVKSTVKPSVEREMPQKPDSNRAPQTVRSILLPSLILAASLCAILAGLSHLMLDDSNASKPTREVVSNSESGSAAGSSTGSSAGLPPDGQAEPHLLPGGVATLTRLIQSQWQDESEALDALSRISSGQEIRLESGQAELLFDSGVEIVLIGPAHLKVESAMNVSVEYGTFSARVGPRGKGFKVRTPSAEVVDLGTEFGLAVSPDGDTEVAVFQGIVDLSYDDPDPDSDTTRERLNQGEAVRVDRSGGTQRVVSIDSERFPSAGLQREDRLRAGPVIESVADNLGVFSSRNFYRIVRGGFEEDATAFVDRGHQWNGINAAGIPEFLLGADYVMPFNDDKLKDELAVTVVLAKPAIVYLLFDNNMSQPPWLTTNFVDTGYDLGLDQDASDYHPLKSVKVGPGISIDDTFSIWQREMPGGGPLVMGGVKAPNDKGGGYNMYGILAVPMKL